MRSKFVAALLVGLLLGLALPYLMGQREVQAQPEKKKIVWEYKTVHTNPIPQGPQAGWPPVEPSGALNPLGAEGWECTGAVIVSDRQQGKVYSFVLKRLR